MSRILVKCKHIADILLGTSETANCTIFCFFTYYNLFYYGFIKSNGGQTMLHCLMVSVGAFRAELSYPFVYVLFVYVSGEFY